MITKTVKLTTPVAAVGGKSREDKKDDEGGVGGEWTRRIWPTNAHGS